MYNSYIRLFWILKNSLQALIEIFFNMKTKSNQIEMW